MYKVGIGYDIHKFSSGRKLFLGGIQVPYKKGLSGHSDADVIIHAVSDALLGAMGEPDIGSYFPNTDAKYKDISSLRLLYVIKDILKKKSFSVVNIDVMLVLEAPKIAHLRDKMSSAIAVALGIKRTSVSIKATTNEGVGDIGKNKAAAAYAVALIRKTKKKKP